MMARTTRPRLVRHARLRFDPHAREWVLLYPERGLALNRTALEIVRLCDGDHSVDAIVRRVHARHPGADGGAVQRDVVTFLERLVDRCLLERIA